MAAQNDTDVADLRAIREPEWRDAEQRSADSLEAYWAGTASASALRDYAAGRVSTHVARRRPRRPVR